MTFYICCMQNPGTNRLITERSRFTQIGRAGPAGAAVRCCSTPVAGANKRTASVIRATTAMPIYEATTTVRLFTDRPSRRHCSADALSLSLSLSAQPLDPDRVTFPLTLSRHIVYVGLSGFSISSTRSFPLASTSPIPAARRHLAAVCPSSG